MAQWVCKTVTFVYTKKVGHEVVEMVERLCSSMNKDQTQDLLFEIILPTYE